MKYEGNLGEYLLLSDIDKSNCVLLKERRESELTIFWNIEGNTSLLIDGKEFLLGKNQILFLTEFHEVDVLSISRGKVVKFNRPFYCVSDHDDEVSCKGILFFGASQLPIITLEATELPKFNTLWEMFNLEMESYDRLQNEMLLMMLKRLIILCTRLYKSQKKISLDENGGLNIVREYNYLVENHFKTKHKVSDYADILNKSPKTLSNLFLLYNQKSPLSIIQDRIILEVRRFLIYTDKPVSDIAYNVGYESIQSFSRFFKSQEGCSPKQFREKSLFGKK